MIFDCAHCERAMHGPIVVDPYEARQEGSDAAMYCSEDCLAEAKERPCH